MFKKLICSMFMFQHFVRNQRRRAQGTCGFYRLLHQVARTLSIFLAELLVSVKYSNFRHFVLVISKIAPAVNRRVCHTCSSRSPWRDRCSTTLNGGQGRTNQNAHKARLRSHPMLENSRMVVGVFSDQEMKKKGTEPATTSQRRNETLSHTK